MKYLLALAFALGVSATAFASMRCYTTTYSYEGRIVTCNVCCDGHGNCTQNCF